MEPDIIVGIDLGTTNSLVGAMDAGFPVLCADAEGRRLTPSVVSFPAAAGGGLPAAAPLVGWPAARQRVLRPRHTVFSVKRLMGLRSDDPAVREARAAGLPYEVVPAAGEPPGPVRVRVDGVDHAPEQIAALILGQLRADAARALGAPVRRAVITVPAYFNDAQRQATKTAGELAGLAVERILNEPTAAALAYGLDRLGERSRVAVYDLGGGTFDLSILELNQGVFEVLATNGHTRLGGDDIDAALTARLAARLGVPPGGDAFLALREQAHDAKVRLSTEPETTVALPFGLGAHGREGAAVVVTREELEELARPLVERTGWHCRRALADARLDPADLQAVVLVGGATRMPLVRRFAGELFGRDPDTTQHPDEAVARGAVIQAGVLAGSVRNVVLLDVIPLSLGLETFGGLTNVIIPRNTTIPAKAGEMFTNAVAGQTAVRLRVLQGERERARDNWTLGTFDLPFAPAPRAQARVGVQFSVDADGILTVLARDVRTGQEKVVQIERGAVDVSDEAVEKMIADSVEHAFDDYHDRLLTEAQLKAREMVPAARQALELVGPELAPAERARVQALVGALETALADPATDLERLRHATGELDAGTQDLATLLVERLLGQPGQS